MYKQNIAHFFNNSIEIKLKMSDFTINISTIVNQEEVAKLLSQLQELNAEIAKINALGFGNLSNSINGVAMLLQIFSRITFCL